MSVRFKLDHLPWPVSSPVFLVPLFANSMRPRFKNASALPWFIQSSKDWISIPCLVLSSTASSTRDCLPAHPPFSFVSVAPTTICERERDKRDKFYMVGFRRAQIKMFVILTREMSPLEFFLHPIGWSLAKFFSRLLFDIKVVLCIFCPWS